MPLKRQITQAFAHHFSTPPTFIVRAPGRVNLIGEHTDYNDGFVLPIAIDRAIWIALRPRDDRRVVVHSLNLNKTVEFSLAVLARRESGWAEYIKGVAWALQEAGYKLAGWEGVLSGDVPIGAGLSSSAALEIAAARAFAAVSDLSWEPTSMAKIGQRAENEWVGMNCGIMDQMISAAGRAGHALLIDCRSLETDAVPLPPGTSVVVMDTATRRGLVGSAYNERRTQCEAAARFFNVAALRDVSAEQLQALESGDGPASLDELTLRRARHVVTENARTVQAANAMRRGDALTLGRLMDASHVSMRDDFEISSDELNAMVRCARQQEGCYGARMTGGGFGGCAVALVRAEIADAFATAVDACYHQATGLVPNIYVCQATDGARLIQ